MPALRPGAVQKEYQFFPHRLSQIPVSGPPRLTDDQLRAAVDYIHDNIRKSLELRSISRVRRDALWDAGLTCSLPDGFGCIPRLLSHAGVPIREDSLISRLTLDSASKQIALRMNAKSPFPPPKRRSDNSDLALYPKIVESLVRRVRLDNAQ